MAKYLTFLLKNRNGIIEIDGWEIKAEMNASNNPALNIKKDGVGMIDFGRKQLTFEGQVFKHNNSGSTILLEVVNGKVKKQEVVDQLPHQALYY